MENPDPWTDSPGGRLWTDGVTDEATSRVLRELDMRDFNSHDEDKVPLDWTKHVLTWFWMVEALDLRGVEV